LRVPKRLDAAPAHLTFATDGSGTVLKAPQGRRHGRQSAVTPGGAGGVTDERGSLEDAEPDRSLPVGEAIALARRIESRLAVRLPALRPLGRATHGDWRSSPYRGGPGDIDLEATVEARLASRGPLPADLIVREREAARRAVILAVDVSGSSRGHRMLSAAAVVGALTSALVEDKFAVVAFWSDATTLVELDEVTNSAAMIRRLSQLHAQGLTNVSFPLELAAQKLTSRDRAIERRVLLLSDCVHNAGPDPRIAASRLPRLDVLLDVTGECDRKMGSQLATEGRGRCFAIAQPGDIAVALSSLFGS
jgi:Mg-chelatase subunit ChlD